MTDYAAAWLSEMWPTVRQYREGDPLPKRKPRKPEVRKARDGRNPARENCPICGADLTSAYVLAHIIRRHPENVEKPVNDGEKGAA